MRFNKLKTSVEATNKLRSIRQRTGVSTHLLCRIAIMLSLEEGPALRPAPDENGQEFNAYTLTGDYQGLILAMLRFVEEDEAKAGPLTDEQLLARFKAHLHRGVATLSVRAKSPADIGRLALAA